MNTKRQTIWLVSMLSIMVILSAYYLFNGQSEDKNIATLDDILAGSDSYYDHIGEWDGLVLDQDILDHWEANALATSGANFFFTQQLQRNEDYLRESDRLMQLFNSSNQSLESTNQIYTDMIKLEELYTKITYLEEELSKDYPQVFVSHEADNKVKIYVESDQLQKSQAVSIVEMAMAQLDISPDQIVVEYIQ